MAPSNQEQSSEESPVDDSKVEKGPNDQQASPKPVGFFHPALDKVRSQVFLLWARTTLILCVFILSVLSLYWASQYHVYANYSALGVYVVDFDGMAPYDTSGPPLLGPMITRQLDTQNILAEPTNRLQLTDPPPHLGYEIRPPSMFNNDPMQVRQVVYNQDVWAAIIVNSNATALLREAVAIGNTSYDPSGAAQLVYVQARDQDTVDTYIVPTLDRVQIEMTSLFGQMWTEMVLQNASDPAVLANIQRVPQALSPAIGFSVFNLRPFTPAVATPAVTVGLIYLIIISFFSYTFYLPIHMKFVKPEGHPPLIYWQEVAWRWIATIVAYLFLSLFYSLISLAFQIPFSNSAAPATVVANNANEYGKGSFPVFWMVNYFGMIALGMACENVSMVVGQPWTAFWLIFWVISNVTTSFYEIALEPKFYYWGYAWPLRNIVEASRTIIFNTHSRIGLNFGVLVAWSAINSILFVPCCYFLRWQMQRQEKKETASKEE